MPSDHHGFIPSSAEEVLRRRVKAELRKRMRGLRVALPSSACAEKSQAIVERLMGIGAVAASRAIALFWPIEARHEVDIRSLHERTAARGARVAYPAVDAETGAMGFRFVADTAKMNVGALGQLEPSADDPEALPGDLDAIVVPALAVDPRGQRVGYGGGYYDRALPRFAPPAVTIAVAFDFQLVADLPDTPGDAPVDWVATDRRTLKAG
jgi:5-formyltetrahydrofolate cyclo-ligase